MSKNPPFRGTTFCIPLASSFGDILLLWENCHYPRLCRIYLPIDNVAELERARADFPDMELWGKGALPSIIEAVAALLQSILGGHPIQIPFPLLEESLKELGDFQRKILLLEATIPFGYLSTYRNLAQASGHPLAFRAVAHVLSHNPLPLLIPCHRVIGADGTLRGYQGGLRMKRQLLEREGIPFSSSVIDLTRAKLWTFSSYKRALTS